MEIEPLSETESKLWEGYAEMEVGDIKKEWFMHMNETRRLLRVPSGFIYTIIRDSYIESTFIPEKVG